LARLAGPGSKATLGPGVLDTLRAYSFPGNVRELENVLERALAFANDGVIEVGDLSLKSARLAEAAPAHAEAIAPDAPAAPVPAAASQPMPAPAQFGPDALPNSLPDYLIQVERDIILRALAQTQFNRTRAAELLGISFRQLRYQMQKLDIQEPDQ
ncbi:MAG: sigma-54-dependent Fis family transcriptional regulator, partial [Massilia sp.]|nr:sigma-54-dependent Fis family transcriptional regulator [Massilia sp.]